MASDGSQPDEWVPEMSTITAVRCAGRSKQTGEPCGRWVTPPATVCRWHGGNAGQVKAAVERRRQEGQAKAAVVTFGLPREIDPQTALLEEVHRTAGHVAYLGQVVAELEQSELTQLDAGERFERPAVWVEMYERERTHLVKVAATCISAGIAERQVRLAEDQGRQLAGVLRDVLADVFGLLGEAGVSVDVLVRVQREAVPGVVRRRLSEVMEVGA